MNFDEIETGIGSRAVRRRRPPRSYRAGRGHSARAWPAWTIGLGALCSSFTVACPTSNGGSRPEPTQAPAPPTPPPPPIVPTPPPPESACNAVEPRVGVGALEERKLQMKIVGGLPSKPDAWPWTVALALEREGKLLQFCGGSLIAADWVLTAAHCQVTTGDKVIAGRQDLTKTNGKVVAIAKVLNHAGYDRNSHDNDVAVIRLAEPVDITAVALQEESSDLAGSTSTVIGWGVVSEGGPQSTKLQDVSVPVVKNAVCSSGYASDGVTITGNMLCAGLPQGGKDSCQGDSGGPLVVKAADGKVRQAGVVSFGIGCARPDRYGVYTRVSNYVPWIRACTKP